MSPRSASADENDDDLYAAPTRTSRISRNRASPSSDKENTPAAAKGQKGKQVDVDPAHSNRRRSHGGGLQEMDASGSAQALHNQRIRDDIDPQYYDPDQSPEERRAVRREYRELQRNFDDQKQQFLQPGNDGILETFETADTLFKRVKQTADATLDSRILVAASDLALKKVQRLNGSTGVGIDVHEFVGKCMSFMRSSATRRGRASTEEAGPADDDAMDFARLGREVAFKGNRRPATTDFMLGPLSVQKRIRVQKARRQGLARKKGQVAQQPIEVDVEDIQQSENNTLKLVYRINTFLNDYFEKNEIDNEEGLNLFEVVVNPTSFSQTVENIFYVSFLVKEGNVSIWEDENGLLRLSLNEPLSAEDRKEQRIVRHQMIFPMTMWDWKQAIEIFGIEQCIIPTRPKEVANITPNGWYSA